MLFKTKTTRGKSRRGPARYLAFFLLSSFIGAFAYAVHDVGLFELDGNTVDAGGTPGDDWSNVFNDTDGAFATAFINDSFANGVIPGFESRTPEVSFFTGGGSKDTACLQDPCDSPLGGAGGPWLYDTVNDVVPDKNDIVTAFAAAYDDPDDGHTIFYFGLDTYAVQGDSNAGFWFFRDQVGLEPLAAGETQGGFTGDHTDGDIFVAVAYTGGGKVGEIIVYQWDATIGPGNKPIGLVQVASGLDCADVAVNDDVCGVVNSSAGENPPWDYFNKEGEATYKVPAFVEFGLDVTAILGDDIGCFSSFLAETRSSQSETAQLKDFALGAFPVCGIEVNKTGDALSKVGDEVNYTINIENTGRATLYADTISDSLVGDILVNGVDQGNAAVTGNTCGASLAPLATCTIQLAYTVMAGDVVDDQGDTVLPNVVSINYTERDDFSGLALADSDSHTVNLFEPAISFDKSGTPLQILQGGSVDYTLLVTNDSSADTPTLNCVVDDPTLEFNSGAFDLAASASFTASKQFLNLAADPSCNQPVPDGDYFCKNTATVTCTLPDPYPNELVERDMVTVQVTPAVPTISIVKDGDDYSKEGDDVDYTITVSNDNPNFGITITSLTDNVLGDLLDNSTPNPFVTSFGCGNNDTNLLLASNTQCVVTATRTTQAGDSDPKLNEVIVVGVDAFGSQGDARDNHSVDLLHPDFTVTKSCASNEPVPAGASANFRIRITNTGDPELLADVFDPAPFTPSVDQMDVLLGEAPAGGCLESDYGDGIGAADAADGCYQIEGGIIASGTQVSNRVDVSVTLPARFGLANQIDKFAEDSCDVRQGDATRTWGFWKTHGSDGPIGEPPVDGGYTCHVFEAHLGGTMNLGWKQVDSCSELFQIFWAHRAKESDGGKRDKVCQAQVRCSGQVAAAILNTGLDNGAALDPDDLTDVLNALSNGNRRQINNACSAIAAYNESGDDVMIIDLDGTMIPHADPNGTRSAAGDYSFADCNEP